MIIDWIYGLFVSVSEWVLGLLPTFDPAPALIGLDAVLGPVSAGASALGGWIPWGAVNIMVGISVSLYVAGLVLRAIKSLIPTLSG